MTRGMTLLELVIVLAVFGVVLGLAAPRLAAGLDGWVVREAREDIVALLYRARMEARRTGEATVVIESGGGAELEVPGWERPLVWTPSDPQVVLGVGGSRDRARIVFGPSGVGRVASTTLKVRRGAVEATVVVSSYGRIRR